MAKFLRIALPLLALACVLLMAVQLSIGGPPLPLQAPGLPWPQHRMAVALNLALLLALLAAARLLLPLRAVVVLSALACGAFCVLNARKISLLGEPVLVSDAFRFQLSPLTLRFVGVPEWIAVLLLLALPLGFFRKWRVGWGERVFAGSLLAGSLVFVFTFFEPFRMDWLNLRVPRFRSELMEARAYGHPLTFLFNARSLRVEFPPDYSEANVRAALANFGGAKASGPARDVVLVLLESFNDLSSTGLRFQEDFTPFFHRLQKEGAAFELLSPVVGGITANAEYEVLTGLPSKFVPGGTVPYLSYIRHSLPALPGAFRAQGYEAVALHPGEKKFWNRSEVYPHLGFDRFLGPEDFPGVAKLRDRDLFEHSLSLLEAKARKPQFHFLITLGTHGPYAEPAPARSWLREPSSLDPGLTRRVNRFAELMRELDRDLEEYFRALRKLPNPPLVLLFGDHQPELAWPLSGGGQAFDPYRTQAVLWRGGEVAALPVQDLFCVAPLLLRESGRALSPYFRYVQKFCGGTGSLGNLVPGQAEYSQAVERFRVLAFDRLFGRQFSER